MKEEIYLWMKNLAVFYILFTAVLHLVPDKKYESYVRSFMGLLLIYMMCTPVFSLFGKGGELLENFKEVFRQEQKLMDAFESEELQAFYLKEGYEKELAREITGFLKKSGINPVNTAVHIEGEEISLVLTVGQELAEEQEGGIRDALRQSFGITEKNCQILTDKNDRTAVDDPSASGTSSDGNRSSGIGQQ